MENNFNEDQSLNNKNKGPLSNLTPVFFIFMSLTIVFILYQIIGGSVTLFFLGEDQALSEENLNITRIIISFAQFMFILAPTILLVMLQGDNFKETFRLKMPKFSVLIFAIFGLFIVQPFLQLFLYYQNEFIFSLPFGQETLSQLKELFDMLESSTEKLVISKSFPEFILIVFVIAVTPAVCEEFLFRGLVFRNLEKVIPASKAIFFTGLLFALFHFHPFNLIPLVILGIYLTFIVYHSGSIYTAIICHFLNNLISAAAIYIYGTESLHADKMSGDEQMQFILLGGISLVVFILVIYLIKKYSVYEKFNDLKNESDKDNESKSKLNSDDNTNLPFSNE
ncbi:MAG TPA: CPBP family intramembrane metalloprotease [Ignavibacteria bacterium]|nr:CPBP family intramembrane metalloprotease [Ignavibacteria bacterium]